jgi:hypothetical protein
VSQWGLYLWRMIVWFMRKSGWHEQSLVWDRNSLCECLVFYGVLHAIFLIWLPYINAMSDLGWNVSCVHGFYKCWLGGEVGALLSSSRLMDSVYRLPFCIKFAHNNFHGILLDVHRLKYLQHALSLLFDTATLDVDWSDIFAKTSRLAYLPIYSPPSYLTAEKNM